MQSSGLTQALRQERETQESRQLRKIDQREDGYKQERAQADVPVVRCTFPTRISFPGNFTMRGAAVWPTGISSCHLDVHPV